MTPHDPVAPTTVAQALRHAGQAGLPRIDAQMLLLHTLGCASQDRGWLLGRDHLVLTAQQNQQFQQWVQRRLAHEPMAYLIGQHEFYGLPLQVDARVLDPRADTETLVDWALQILPADGPARVVDLGTGSGAIALAIAHHRPRAEVWATDASTDALAVARGNAQELGLRIHWAQGDWLAALPSDMVFDLIVSNPPYIAQNDPHLATLQHEPAMALVGGPDGLDDLREICAHSHTRLTPSGWLLLEHGYDQAARVRALLAAAGLQNIQSHRDLAGIERCSGGQRAPLG